MGICLLDCMEWITASNSCWFWSTLRCCHNDDYRHWCCPKSNPCLKLDYERYRDCGCKCTNTKITMSPRFLEKGPPGNNIECTIRECTLICSKRRGRAGCLSRASVCGMDGPIDMNSESTGWLAESNLVGGWEVLCSSHNGRFWPSRWLWSSRQGVLLLLGFVPTTRAGNKEARKQGGEPAHAATVISNYHVFFFFPFSKNYQARGRVGAVSTIDCTGVLQKQGKFSGLACFECGTDNLGPGLLSCWIAAMVRLRYCCLTNIWSLSSLLSKETEGAASVDRGASDWFVFLWPTTVQSNITKFPLLVFSETSSCLPGSS